MGMRLHLIMIAPDQIEAVARDEERLFTLIEDPQPPTGLDIEKAWHGIHYLLNGTPFTANGPLGAVILGGQDIGSDLGYGPPRVLTAPQVREVSQALMALPPDHLPKRFDPKAMDSADVYPTVWVREGSASLEWLQSTLVDLVDF